MKHSIFSIIAVALFLLAATFSILNDASAESTKLRACYSQTVCGSEIVTPFVKE